MNSILTKIRGIFPYHKILLAYYSGSIAYGINDEHSDTDVTVVLEDFRDNIHLNLGQVDLFIFSKERFLARHSFDETITAYHRSSTDTFLSLEKTLIHIDSDFKETVDKLLNINHRMFLLKSLEAELEYGKEKPDMKLQRHSNHIIISLDIEASSSIMKRLVSLNLFVLNHGTRT